MGYNTLLENTVSNSSYSNEIINFQKENIDRRWSRAINRSNVNELLPVTKGELNYFEIWWYNLALLKETIFTQNNTTISKEQVVLGYYKEPVQIGNWFYQQNESNINNLSKCQLNALKDVISKLEDTLLNEHDMVTKWLDAIENNTVKQLLLPIKPTAKLWNWLYNYSLAYFYFQKFHYLFLEDDTIIKGYYKEKVEITKWLNSQKPKEINGQLDDWQIAALDKINMVWSKNSSHYRTKMEENVAARWLYAIQNNCVDKLLSRKPEHLNKYNEWWYNYYMAKQYHDKQKVPNLNVNATLEVIGRDNKPVKIGKWILAQRKPADLLPIQKAALEKIDIIWKKKLSPEERWLVNYNEVKRYKKIHHQNELSIPLDYEVIVDNEIFRIGLWLKTQKAAYVSGNLLKERREMLEALGISAVCKSHDKQWHEMYQLAQAYRNEHKNLFVSPNSDNVKLYCWILEQRESYQNGKMDPKRKKLLDDIELPFENIDFYWLKMYYYAKRYLKNNKILKAMKNNKELQALRTYKFQDDDGKEIPLISWLGEQQEKYRAGSLNSLQIEYLENIGFITHKGENKVRNIKMFENAGLGKYATKEIVENYSYLELNAKYWYCIENDIALIQDGKLNSIFTKSSVDMELEDHVSLEEIMILYRNRIALSRTLK